MNDKPQKPVVVPFPVSEAEPTEPDWKLLYQEALDRHTAHAHWQRISSEMRQAGTLTPANGHAIERLITAYLVNDQARTSVIEKGALKISKKGGQAYNLEYHVMRSSDETIRQLEAELGISPLRRGRAGKVARKDSKPRAADAYLNASAKKK